MVERILFNFVSSLSQSASEKYKAHKVKKKLFERDENLEEKEKEEEEKNEENDSDEEEASTNGEEIDLTSREEIITPIDTSQEGNTNNFSQQPVLRNETNDRGTVPVGQPEHDENQTNPLSYETVISSQDGSNNQQKIPTEEGYVPTQTGESGQIVNDEVSRQNAEQTLQNLIDNWHAIEKEINDIEEKINGINNDIESGKINATEGAAKVKSLMA